MKYFQKLIVLILASLIITGCTNDNDQSSNSKNSEITIYTSVYPLKYAVAEIAGDTVTVETVFPPGTDAHTYEPSSRDIVEIAESDAFIYLGANMEAFSTTIADAVSAHDVKLIEIGEHDELFGPVDPVDHKHEADDEHHHEGDHNPHIWIDPLKMIQSAEIVKDELIEINPEQSELYNDNFQQLLDNLTELEEEFNNVLSEKENKKIIVSHAAFGYWERYGIEQIPISGLSSTEEPSQKQLTEIIEQSKEHNLEYVLFEQNTSNRLAEIIKEEIGAESLILHNLEVLTEDDVDKGENYISLMKYNLEILDQATN